MSKSEPTLKISAIVCGAKDNSGNAIVNVLASGNEYAIYEIDHPDINNRLRVFLDGYDDESEKRLIDRFNSVKQKYIEAKGLLYRSSNFGMMKNRVAHTLSSCLTSDSVDGVRAFDQLIATIRSEHEASIRNRAAFLLPSLCLTIGLFIIALMLMEQRKDNSPWWQVVIALLAASLGGSLSMLVNIRKLQFEEFRNSYHYILIGMERLFLANIAGAIAFIAVKARFLMPESLESSYWGVMITLVAAGFSEALVPSIIGKLEKRG